MSYRLVTLWADEPSFGCGYRQFCALIGRKYVRLVELSSGNSAKAPLEILRHAQPLKVSHNTARRRLWRNSRVYNNQASSHVKAACLAMRDPP